MSGFDWNLCWVRECALQVRTVADTDRLAQASLTRPGEMCRGSPRAFWASGRLGDQGVFWASTQLAQAREGSRLSETRVAFLFLLSPRLGGRGLVWARPLSLSEVLGETVRWLNICLFLNGLFWVGYECMMSDRYVMEYEVYVVWSLDYKW